MNATQFNHEYEHVAGFLDRLAFELTQDRTLAQELIQDTHLRALSSCECFEAGTNFKAWMSSIMRNTFLSGYRRPTRTSHQGARVGENGELLHHSTVGSNESHNLHLDQLEATLARIDPLYAKPFGLFYSGFGYDEIAQATGLSLPTVRSRILTARKQLKLLLAADKEQGARARARTSVA